ncbi:ABC transporter family substrate-binding protein [Rothia sp. P100]|uniref:ABC transporter family substrate-binding protein n=1 Tax=Rothia sp. P100 TaxID=2939578 RepID=UPI00203B1876|nr:ABC transporter family substrate-binding protein [Rothia sp. P100]MCM3510671.1 ABC transporter family substrate-binding protein [Rothia sp. P100]
MRKTRITSALSLSAVAALALSACASTDSGSSASGDSSADSSKSASIAITNVFSSLNTDTAEGNSDTNGIISAMTTRGFYTITDEFDIRHNDWFGSYDMTEEGEGMKVDYKVNDDQKWSDGNDIDKGDLLLAWAAYSGYFNGEGEEGVTFFDYAGETAGLGEAGMPELGEDGRSITFSYPKAFADWESAFNITTPAHVVAELAGLDEETLVETIQNATPGEENENLQKIADAWNTGFNTTTMPDNEALTVGNGPYLVTDVVENQSITLTANENYQGDTKPAIGEVVLRVNGDASSQVQALKNGEVDAVAPQASVDTISQLQELENTTTTVQPDQSYDHLDLNMVSGGVFEDKDVREAFLLTVPRQQILDSLIKPMDPEAEVLNSQLYVASDTENYDDAVAQNNSDMYPSDDMDANIEKAKELLDGKTPTVRILYNTANPNRVNSFAMIQESASKAGFDVVDAGTEQWSSLLPTGKDGGYDASIFGWVSSGIGNSSLGQIFKEGSPSNFNSYSNDIVNANADEIMVTLDQARIEELKKEADGEIFKDAYGLPLFQSIAVTSYNSDLTGVKPKPGQQPLTWNIEEWDFAE